jgi:AcrR family transcriptional regulator
MTTLKTYEKILQTAYTLFLQQGYTATSMRQVAEKAGIGKATIYHHFPDKQSIALALLEKTNANMDSALTLVRAEQDPRQRIRVAVMAYFNSLLKSLDIMQIVRRELPDGRTHIQAGFSNFFQESLALLIDAIQRGIEQGVFRPVNPEKAAKTFMAMIIGNFAMTYLGGARPQLSEETATAFLEIYLQGIAAP